MEKFGIGWSLKLTGESGYLIALILGLFIANVLPNSPAGSLMRRGRSYSSRPPLLF